MHTDARSAAALDLFCGVLDQPRRFLVNFFFLAGTAVGSRFFFVFGVGCAGFLPVSAMPSSTMENCSLRS